MLVGTYKDGCICLYSGSDNFIFSFSFYLYEFVNKLKKKRKEKEFFWQEPNAATRKCIKIGKRKGKRGEIGGRIIMQDNNNNQFVK